jgi:hypothetical protein
VDRTQDRRIMWIFGKLCVVLPRSFVIGASKAKHVTRIADLGPDVAIVGRQDTNGRALMGRVLVDIIDLSTKRDYITFNFISYKVSLPLNLIRGQHLPVPFSSNPPKPPSTQDNNVS